MDSEKGNGRAQAVDGGNLSANNDTQEAARDIEKPVGRHRQFREGGLRRVEWNMFRGRRASKTSHGRKILWLAKSFNLFRGNLNADKTPTENKRRASGDRF